MEDRIVGFGTSGFELPDITANRDAVVKNFVDEAKRLINLGAVIILWALPVPRYIAEVVARTAGAGGQVSAHHPHGGTIAGLGLKQPRALAKITQRLEVNR
jgi:hypothetical protein